MTIEVETIQKRKLTYNNSQRRNSSWTLKLPDVLHADDQSMPPTLRRDH